MKLLIISGTPKKEGITHSMAQAAFESAPDAEVIQLSDYNLPVCRMCNDGWGTCMSHHECTLGKDDKFNELQQKVEEADAFVLVSPVYWGGLSEAMKIFLDRLLRCQGSKQWNGKDDKNSFMIGKPAIMVAIAGGSGGGVIRALHELEHFVWCASGTVHDYVAVNRWNQDYKREALRAAVKAMVADK